MVKVDISKMYDGVNWNYLHGVLTRFGFVPRWVECMMFCVISFKYLILLNNQKVGPIIPKRGLQQGDPLLPYLFILVVEGLSSLIKHTKRQHLIHEVKIYRGGPTISHLLFADDCMFFCRASKEECLALKNIFTIYELASGQAINFSKSDLFFSRNVSVEKKVELIDVLNIRRALDTSRYLGLPSFISSKKKAIFNYLKDRTWKGYNHGVINHFQK